MSLHHPVCRDFKKGKDITQETLEQNRVPELIMMYFLCVPNTSH